MVRAGGERVGAGEGGKGIGGFQSYECGEGRGYVGGGGFGSEVGGSAGGFGGDVERSGGRECVGGDGESRGNFV